MGRNENGNGREEMRGGEMRGGNLVKKQPRPKLKLKIYISGFQPEK